MDRVWAPVGATRCPQVVEARLPVAQHISGPLQAIRGAPAGVLGESSADLSVPEESAVWGAVGGLVGEYLSKTEG